jgi:hypothetical protein
VLNCHSGWASIGWNVVAAFGSQRAVFQAGLYLSRKTTDQDKRHH